MVDKIVVYRSYLLHGYDFQTEKEAKLAEIQQQVHLLSGGATHRSYIFRTDGIRKLLDQYDEIDKDND